MLSKNKKMVIVAVAVIALISFSSLAYSQCCGWDSYSGSMYNNGYMGDYGPGWWNNNVPSQYWLSSEQINQITGIRTDYNAKLLPLMQEIRSLRIEFRGYAARPNADMDRIKRYRNEIQKLQNEAADLRLRARAEISKILTKEQQAYFNNYVFGGWWDWNMDGDMMYGMDMNGRMMMGGMMNGCRDGDWW